MNKNRLLLPILCLACQAVAMERPSSSKFEDSIYENRVNQLTIYNTISKASPPSPKPKTKRSHSFTIRPAEIVTSSSPDLLKKNKRNSTGSFLRSDSEVDLLTAFDYEPTFVWLVQSLGHEIPPKKIERVEQITIWIDIIYKDLLGDDQKDSDKRYHPHVIELEKLALQSYLVSRFKESATKEINKENQLCAERYKDIAEANRSNYYSLYYYKQGIHFKHFVELLNNKAHSLIEHFDKLLFFNCAYSVALQAKRFFMLAGQTENKSVKDMLEEMNTTIGSIENYINKVVSGKKSYKNQEEDCYKQCDAMREQLKRNNKVIEKLEKQYKKKKSALRELDQLKKIKIKKQQLRRKVTQAIINKQKEFSEESDIDKKDRLSLEIEQLKTIQKEKNNLSLLKKLLEYKIEALKWRIIELLKKSEDYYYKLALQWVNFFSERNPQLTFLVQANTALTRAQKWQKKE